jgi:hypothetical protein
MGMRETFETDVDRGRQERVAETVTYLLGQQGKKWSAHATPQYHPLDFYFQDSEDAVVAWGELKVRNNRHDTFPTYMVGVSKLNELANTGKIGFLFVLFTDCLVRVMVQPKQVFKTQHGARSAQPRDEYDAKGEQCVYFPIEQLKKFDLPKEAIDYLWNGR